MHIFAVNIASEFMSKCPDKINNSHFISLALGVFVEHMAVCPIL